MIQVIKRAFGIIEFLSMREAVSLKAIASQAGLKTTTANTILKTLAHLGYLQQDDLRRYFLGAKFDRLISDRIIQDALGKAAAGAVKALSMQIRETVLVAILQNATWRIIAEAASNQLLTINPEVYHQAFAYETATGRILLAGLDEPALADFVRQNGLPGKQWKEASCYSKLKSMLGKIRKAALSQLQKKELSALAVPVRNADGKIVASIGAFLPTNRFSPEKKMEITDGLRSAAAEMESALSKITIR